MLTFVYAYFAMLALGVAHGENAHVPAPGYVLVLMVLLIVELIASLVKASTGPSSGK